MNKREQQRIATLEKLRSTVDALVHENGFEKMTIRQICERANVTTGAFYHHFKSKSDLLYDRYVRGSDMFSKLERDELSAMEPLPALKRLAEFALQYGQSRIPQIALPYHRVLLTEYRSWAQQYEDTFRTIAQSHFGRGQQMNVFASTYSPEELGNMLWCMQIGARYSLLIDGPTFCTDNRIGEQTMLWLDSLAAKPHQTDG